MPLESPNPPSLKRDVCPQLAYRPYLPGAVKCKTARHSLFSSRQRPFSHPVHRRFCTCDCTEPRSQRFWLSSRGQGVGERRHASFYPCDMYQATVSPAEHESSRLMSSPLPSPFPFFSSVLSEWGIHRCQGALNLTKKRSVTRRFVTIKRSRLIACHSTFAVLASPMV